MAENVAIAETYVNDLVPRLETDQSRRRRHSGAVPNFLKEWRVFRHLTLQQVADGADTNRAQIHKLENKASVSTAWLDRLAKPLGCREGAQLMRSPIDRGEVNFDRPAPNPQGALVLEILDFVRRLSDDDQRRALRMLKATFGEEPTSA